MVGMAIPWISRPLDPLSTWYASCDMRHVTLRIYIIIIRYKLICGVCSDIQLIRTLQSDCHVAVFYITTYDNFVDFRALHSSQHEW